jgi:predicted RNA-binding Zn-ribbon protein involved in translation (DUF1610 family)
MATTTCTHCPTEIELSDAEVAVLAEMKLHLKTEVHITCDRCIEVMINRATKETTCTQ